MQLDMDGDHFTVIVSNLRHKTLEPNAIFCWDLVKPERRGQFKAMLDFLGLCESFGNPCGCTKVLSQQFHSATCVSPRCGPTLMATACAVIATFATARTVIEPKQAIDLSYRLLAPCAPRFLRETVHENRPMP